MKTQKSVKDQVVMITGVSSGLGRALAEHVLAQGAYVAGTLRKREQVEAFEALAPGRAQAVVLDITDDAAIARGVAEVIARFGRIDVLVNNAGFGMVGAVEETSLEEAQRIFDTNLFGALRVTQAVLPQMRAQASGRIVMAGAIGGFQGYPGLGVYGAAKGAMEILGEALRGEVKDLGIEVTVLTLGVFRTDFAGRSLERTARTIADYDESTVGHFRAFMDTLSGNQPNDPDKAAEAIARLLELDELPQRLALGVDAVDVVRAKIALLERELEAHDALSRSTAYDGS